MAPVASLVSVHHLCMVEQCWYFGVLAD